MTMYSGLTPVNSSSLGTTFASSGLLVKRNGANIEATDLKADIPVGVTIDESSRDANGDLEAAADATVSIVPLTGVQYLVIHTAGALTIGGSGAFMAWATGYTICTIFGAPACGGIGMNAPATPEEKFGILNEPGAT